MEGAFPEEQGPSEPLVQCQHCGRSFNPTAIEKHQKICRKVFQEKRKAFNSAEDRLGHLGEEAAGLIKNANKIQKEKENKIAAGDNVEEKKKPMPKWKVDSLNFRLGVLQGKAANGDLKAQAEIEKIQEELGVAKEAAGPPP